MLVNEMIDWHIKWSKEHTYAVIVADEQEPNSSVTYAQRKFKLLSMFRKVFR